MKFYVWGYIRINQRLKAFNLGNIISDEHNIKGNNILPNPPINIGIIIEDVINIPWKVILEIKGYIITG